MAKTTSTKRPMSTRVLTAAPARRSDHREIPSVITKTTATGETLVIKSWNHGIR